MSTYARIQAGVVAELFTPPAGATIAECFNAALTWVECDGTPGVAVGWTAVETNGVWAFTAPAAVTLTVAQQALAMLAAGVQIVSTSTPGLNGTYPCDGTTQDHVMAEMLSVQVNGKFADGSAALVWLDSSGTQHTFPSTTEFQAFATAQAAFIAGCMKCVSGISTALPAQPTTIA